MPPEPLEDGFTWALRKALKSRNLAPTEAAEQAGLPPAEVLALSRGKFSPDLARRLAPVLDLDPESFAALPDYHPEVELPPALHRLAFPFDDGSVNAWLVQTAGRSLLFDAGTHPAALSAALSDHDPGALDVFITHPHGDHVGGLPALHGTGHTIRAPAGSGIADAVVIAPGDHVSCRPFSVRAIDLDGHCPGQLGFLIDGLSVPACVVGDAIFAGSVGGTPTPARHATALARIRDGLMLLPDATLILPGHGPPTTVALERENNPFLAGMV